MATSKDLFERANKAIPGGVNSPVRAFGAVGGTPVFFQSGAGSRIRDVEGREYVDCVGSWGPLILGHSHPEVLEAVVEAARKGTTFGAPTEREVELAEMIRGALVEPTPRKKTKPSRGAKKRRVADKRRQSKKKQARRAAGHEE